MDVIDFFAFTIETPNEAVLHDLSSADIAENVRAAAGGRVNKSQFVIFDPDLPNRAGQLEAFSAALRDCGCFYSQIAPIGAPDAVERIGRARDAGATTLAFHPYLQDLDNSRIAEAVSLARAGAALGMSICVCTAYGSRKIYAIEPLRVAAAMAEVVSTAVVLVHGGGAKVLDAMLLADAFPQVYLDTSFSLSYWLGSSVELDLVFAMRKLGPEKWLFGSDSPFVNLETALNDHSDFFERHGFPSEFVASVMGPNALKILEVAR